MAARVANAFYYANAGLMSSVSMLACTLGKYVFRHGQSSAQQIFNSKSSVKTQQLIGLAILSLFGTLHQRGIMTLKELMQAIVDPSNEDFDYTGNTVGVPIVASLKAISDILSKTGSTVPTVRQPFLFSKPEIREEVFKEYQTEFPTIAVQYALHKAKILWENQDKYVANYAQNMICPVTVKGETKLSDINFDVLPQDYKLLMIQLNAFAEELLGLQDTKWHPEALYDHIFDLANKHARTQDRLLSFDESMDLLERVEALSFKLHSQEPLVPGKTSKTLDIERTSC